MNRKISLIIIAIFAVLPNAFSKTIELTNGNTIVCEILNETDSYVTVSQKDGAIVWSVPKERIVAVRDSTAKELERAQSTSSSAAPTPSSTVRQPYAGNRAGEKKLTREEKLKAYREERYKKEVEAAKKSRGRVVIPYVEGKKGVVRVKLNGRVITNMFVDTGASMVVVSRRIADKLKIDYTKAKGKIQVVLANGSTDVATAIVLDSIDVGSSGVKDVEAAITENPPGYDIDGLLGMSFLRYFNLQVDSDGKGIVLEKY